MPSVGSAEEATKIAIDFLRDGGWAFPRAVGAHQENGVWVVEVDVGSLICRFGTVRISAANGSILEYRLPTPVS